MDSHPDGSQRLQKPISSALVEMTSQTSQKHFARSPRTQSLDTLAKILSSDLGNANSPSNSSQSKPMEPFVIESDSLGFRARMESLLGSVLLLLNR